MDGGEWSWSDRASGTSLIDASSWWDRVAEGEASASGMAMSTETCKIASQQKSKTLKSLQVNQKVNKITTKIKVNK